AGPVPIGIIFVAGLVVAVEAIILRRRAAGLGAAVHQILAAVGIQHRHAFLGEAEMVRAVIIAGLGAGLVAHDEAALRGGALEIIVELGLGAAGDDQVAGHAGEVEPVHVHAADGARERVDRVLGIILRAEQPRFL